MQLNMKKETLDFLTTLSTPSKEFGQNPMDTAPFPLDFQVVWLLITNSIRVLWKDLSIMESWH
jgi:hypothetical protein